MNCQAFGSSFPPYHTTNTTIPTIEKVENPEVCRKRVKKIRHDMSILRQSHSVPSKNE